MSCLLPGSAAATLQNHRVSRGETPHSSYCHSCGVKIAQDESRVRIYQYLNVTLSNQMEYGCCL